MIEWTFNLIWQAFLQEDRERHKGRLQRGNRGGDWNYEAPRQAVSRVSCNPWTPGESMEHFLTLNPLERGTLVHTWIWDFCCFKLPGLCNVLCRSRILLIISSLGVQFAVHFLTSWGESSDHWHTGFLLFKYAYIYTFKTIFKLYIYW